MTTTAASNLGDYARFISAYGHDCPCFGGESFSGGASGSDGAGWPTNGGFDYDGDVDLDDALAILAWFGIEP